MATGIAVAKKPKYKSFGESLAAARTAKEMTVEQCAAASGVSPENWTNMEAGQLFPRVKFLWQAAVALGIEPKELLL